MRGARGLFAVFVLFVLGAVPACRRAGDPAETGTGSAIRYRDVARSAGLRFHFDHGGRSPLTTLETLGHGCAFLDVDGDGHLDAWLLAPNQSRLFRNQGNGTFTDVSAQAHADLPGYWHGIGVADYDGDGYPDVCLVGYGCLALLRNEHGVFRNVTAGSGLQVPVWGSSCAWGDLDGDGRPDLIVGDYLEFNSRSVQFCTVGSVKTACGPKIYPARHPRVYRNLGGGKFQDVTRQWGFEQANGKALGIAVGDFNGDGLLDVAITNDEMPQDLFIRQPGRPVRFRNEAVVRGFSYLATGAVQSGMGVDAADYDNDGREDLVTTNFQGEPSGLYHNDGSFFAEISTQVGLGQPTFPLVGWGVRFLDADNDGNLDLMMANGHIQDNVQLTGAGSSYPQPLLMLRNDGHGHFHNLGAAAGEVFGRKLVGRGLAVGDFDNDGRPDVLINDLEGDALLLHNESPAKNHWLGVEVAPDRPGRLTLGALVRVGSAQRRVLTSGSIFSAHDPRALFGLGTAAQSPPMEVRWPDGKRESFPVPGVDRYLRVTYGRGQPR